jgi:molybdopterin-guanine dinucleotide biosynthesis protein A
VLAGGRGERLGGDKALAIHAGRPLIEHAVDALRPLVDGVAVVAKPQTRLPDGLEVWHDDEPGFHPRNGIATALRRAEGPVLVLAVDLPDAAPALQALVRVGPTTVTRADGRLQPLCALYDVTALRTLEAAAPDEPLTRTVERLHPTVLDVPAAWLINLNTPEDLASG